MKTTVVAAGAFGIEARQPGEPMYIRHDRGRIIEVGQGEPARRSDETVIDLASCWLMPGMIDTHSHLCLDPDLADPVGAALASAGHERRADATRRASAALRAGITCLRDLGDVGGTVGHVRAEPSDTVLPTLLTAGAPITVPGGHLHQFGGAVESRDQAMEAIASRRAAGADVIKIMVSGGFLTATSSPHRLQFGVDDLAAMVAQARLVGLPVAAHAHSVASIELSACAGVDTIEHCTFVDGGAAGPDPSLVARLASRRGWVCPTFVPSALGNDRSTARRQQTLRKLHHAGVRFVAGTDAGALPGVRHHSLPDAVLAMVSIGVPIKDALKSATSTAAAACGLEGRKGVLRPGADADLVVLNADPLVTPETICEPRAVVTRGRHIDLSSGERNG